MSRPCEVGRLVVLYTVPTWSPLLVVNRRAPIPSASGAAPPHPPIGDAEGLLPAVRQALPLLALVGEMLVQLLLVVPEWVNESDASVVSRIALVPADAVDPLTRFETERLPRTRPDDTRSVSSLRDGLGLVFE